VEIAGGLQSVAPLQAFVFVEIESGIQADIDFDEASGGLDADVFWAAAVTLVVRAASHTVWVLEEEDLLGLGGGKVDVVGCRDGVVVVFSDTGS